MASVGQLPHRDGLHDAEGAYGGGQLLETLWVKVSARLVRIGLDLVDGYLANARGVAYIAE